MRPVLLTYLSDGEFELRDPVTFQNWVVDIKNNDAIGNLNSMILRFGHLLMAEMDAQGNLQLINIPGLSDTIE